MAVQKYGLDLGTGTIKIYKDGQGMVLKEKNKASSQHIIGWKCRRCGYVHIGEILPNNFICPLCGRGKDDFDPIFKEEIEN